MKGFLEKYDLHETSNGCLVRPRRFGSEVAYVIVLHPDGGDEAILERELNLPSPHDELVAVTEMRDAAREFYSGLL